MKILVINGPNLNMLGIREPDIYGRQTYEDMRKYIMDYARQRELAVEVYQSNSEGEIVTKIQQAYGKKDAIIIACKYICSNQKVCGYAKKTFLFLTDCMISSHETLLIPKFSENLLQNRFSSGKLYGFAELILLYT